MLFLIITSVLNNMSSTYAITNYHIRDFKRKRPHLDIAVATSLANALVSSRLDYLFCVLMEEYLTKLQRVQNCLAHVVTRSPQLSCSSDLLT